jgi:hypothetical protein
MAWRGLKTVIFETKGGGGLTAALLALAFAAAFASVAAFTVIYLAPRDTLLRMVPPESAIYIHSDGRTASTPIAAILTKGLRPDEAAAFAVPAPTGDLLWGRLLRWRAPNRPSEQEKSAFESMGAVAIDERTWLIGEPEVAAALAASHGASLHDDPEARRALSLVRQLFPWQAYLNPSYIPANRLLGGASWVKQAGDFAVGFLPSGDSALLVPATAAVMARLPALPLTENFSPRHDSRTSLTLSDLALPFDFATALLDSQLGLPDATDLGNASRLAAARAELGRALADPDEISVVSPKPTSMPEFVARYGDLDPADAESAILQYMNAAAPQTRNVRFPDGSSALEYWSDPEKFRFTPTGGDDRLKRLTNDAGESLKLFIWGDGSDTVIASSASLIAPISETEDKWPCSRLAGPKFILDTGMMRRLVAFFSIRPKYWELLPTGGQFIELDGGLIAFCG